MGGRYFSDTKQTKPELLLYQKLGSVQIRGIMISVNPMLLMISSTEAGEKVAEVQEKYRYRCNFPEYPVCNSDYLPPK